MILRKVDHKIAYRGIFSILFICIVVFCAAIPVKAETGHTVLPYMANATQYSISDEVVDEIMTNIQRRNPTVNFPEHYIIFMGSEGLWYTYSEYIDTQAYYVYFFDNTNIETSWSSGATFSNFAFFDNTKYMDFRCNMYVSYVYQSIAPDGYNAYVNTGDYYRRLFGDGTPIHIQNSRFDFEYRSYYPVYVSDSFSTLHLGDGSGEILTNGVPVNTGHATPPDLSGNDITSTGHANMPTFPTTGHYTPSTYTPQNYNSTDPDQSLYDLIKYSFGKFIDDVNGQFVIINQNLESLFDYIGETIQNVGQAIINNIKNAISFLYDNLVSLFEPFIENMTDFVGSIKASLDWITEDYDQEAFQDSFEASQVNTLITTVSTSYQTFRSNFSDVAEPQSYVLDLNFNMPSSDHLSSYTVDSEISFDWLLPLRSVYRPLLWVLFIFFAFITILDNIGNYLMGFSGKGE